MSQPLTTTLVLACLTWGLGFAHSAEPNHTPTLLSLRLMPDKVVITGQVASQQILVLGSYSDGFERDVTRQSRFSVAQPNVATIGPRGKVTARKDGSTVLKATFDNQVAAASLVAKHTEQTTPISFQRDIGMILTKRGCNAGDCHGGVKGRGGFKLSINAMNPKEDYRWIVEGGTYQVMSLEAAGDVAPRINVREPEESLLLQKPTLTVDHEGGERLTVDSEDYQMILNWIQSGAPFGSDDDDQRNIDKITVFPKEGLLDTQSSYQILVTAHLADGSKRDITDQVHYESNNDEVVSVSEQGRVRALSRGETAIIVRAAGHTASARFGVIREPPAEYPSVERQNFIDDHVLGKLRRFNIPPSPLSSDAEFLRRVCLDLTGTLPPPERVRDFLASDQPDKRDKLIDTLLDSPEYVDFWTFRLAQLFRVGASPTGAPEHGYAYWYWVWQSIAQNKSYKEIATERLTAQGYEGASRHFLPFGEAARVEDIMPEEVRVFLGRRLDCAQCHAHPFEQWNQDQFWGLAAFFGQLSRTEWTGFGANVLFDDPSGKDPDFGEPPESVKVIHPRRGVEVAPAFLDGRPVSLDRPSDPRKQMAQWMTSHPYFSETLVNRMWGYLFSQGLVEPVDDFRSTNPPMHPELLQALAQDFATHHHDLKHLLRRIIGSKTYQLSSAPHALNADDQTNYSHFIPKPLEAEVLLDAISQVTGVPEKFENSAGGLAPLGTRAIQLEVPDIYPSEFLEMFGRASRNQLPEFNSSPSLRQALHMLVGSTYTKKVASEGGRLDRLVDDGSSPTVAIEELFLASLTRLPTEEERTGLEEVLQHASSKRKGLEDILWSLICSQEFRYNH